jgi:hypothetical protein
MSVENKYMAEAVVVTYPAVTMRMIDEDYQTYRQAARLPVYPAKTAKSQVHLDGHRRSLRLDFKRRPAMVVTGLASLVVLGLGAYFLPPAVAAKSAVIQLEQEASRLSSAYEQCAKDLKGKADTIDPYLQSAVDTYNKQVADCERTRVDMKKAVSKLEKHYGN